MKREQKLLEVKEKQRIREERAKRARERVCFLDIRTSLVCGLTCCYDEINSIVHLATSHFLN